VRLQDPAWKSPQRQQDLAGLPGRVGLQARVWPQSRPWPGLGRRLASAEEMRCPHASPGTGATAMTRTTRRPLQTVAPPFLGAPPNERRGKRHAKPGRVRTNRGRYADSFSRSVLPLTVHHCSRIHKSTFRLKVPDAEIEVVRGVLGRDDLGTRRDAPAEAVSITVRSTALVSGANRAPGFADAHGVVAGAPLDHVDPGTARISSRCSTASRFSIIRITTTSRSAWRYSAPPTCDRG